MKKNNIFKLIIITTFLIAYLISNNTSLKALKKECGPTTSDYLGPYYVANVPERENLLEPKIKGQEVLIKGKVFDYKTLQPISQVVVDIWQAGPQANYWPENNGNYKNYRKAEVKFRGKSITDQEGSFFFRTVLPGSYSNRPVRHYHFKIMHKNYKDLVTQIYYKKDKKLIARDYGARRAEICRLFSINDEKEIEVNFFLE